MITLDSKSKKSIYEQVVDGYKDAIASGQMQAGEKLPSVRDLSRALTINPNTVQKAYRELEREGYIYTSSGLGSFVAKPEDRPRDEGKIAELSSVLQKTVTELRHQGLSPADITVLVRNLLTERGDTK